MYLYKTAHGMYERRLISRVTKVSPYCCRNIIKHTNKRVKCLQLNAI